MGREEEEERVCVCARACEGDDEGWRTRVGERWVEKQRERRREVSVRRIKNAGAKGSRGFHLTE